MPHNEFLRLILVTYGVICTTCIVTAQEISKEARIAIENNVQAMGGKKNALKWNCRSFQYEHFEKNGEVLERYVDEYTLHGMKKSFILQKNGKFIGQGVVTEKDCWEFDENKVPSYSNRIRARDAQISTRFWYLANLVNLLDDKDVNVTLHSFKIGEVKHQVLKVRCLQFNDSTSYTLNDENIVIRKEFACGGKDFSVEMSDFITVMGVKLPTVETIYIDGTLFRKDRLIKFDFIDSQEIPSVFILPKELPVIKLKNQ